MLKKLLVSGSRPRSGLRYALLHESPGIEQVKLTELIAYDPSTIGGLVDRLESKGLVERRPDAADRRLKRLNLTAATRGFFDAHRNEVRAVTNRFKRRSNSNNS